MSALSIAAQVRGARIIQLGRIIDRGLARNEGVPDFEQALYGIHDPSVEALPGALPGVTGASDRISMSTHSGTHMDSLGHIAFEGVLFDGSRIDDPEVQDPARGVRLRTRENFTPLVTRGVLLDFTRFAGVDRLPNDYVITPERIEECSASVGVTIGEGDVVLFRTGWDDIADDPDAFLAMPIPGPDPDAARWMITRGVVASGSDTMPWEAAPGDVPLEAHVEMLPRNGVFIFEMMDLRDLAASGAVEFLFVAAPLRLRWGTGSPINPLAVVLAG